MEQSCGQQNLWQNMFFLVCFLAKYLCLSIKWNLRFCLVEHVWRTVLCWTVFWTVGWSYICQFVGWCIFVKFTGMVLGWSIPSLWCGMLEYWWHIYEKPEYTPSKKWSQLRSKSKMIFWQQTRRWRLLIAGSLSSRLTTRPSVECYSIFLFLSKICVKAK